MVRDLEGICGRFSADQVPAFSKGRSILLSYCDVDGNLEPVIDVSHALSQVRMLIC